MLWWEDREANFGHVKLVACQLGVSETAEVGDEIQERSGVERFIWDLSIQLLAYSA